MADRDELAAAIRTYVDTAALPVGAEEAIARADRRRARRRRQACIVGVAALALVALLAGAAIASRRSGGVHVATEGRSQPRAPRGIVAVTASALSELQYGFINANPQTPNASATRIDMRKDWLKTNSARA